MTKVPGYLSSSLLPEVAITCEDQKSPHGINLSFMVELIPNRHEPLPKWKIAPSSYIFVKAESDYYSLRTELMRIEAPDEPGYLWVRPNGSVIEKPPQKCMITLFPDSFVDRPVFFIAFTDSKFTNLEAKEIKQGDLSKIKWRTQILELEWLHGIQSSIKELEPQPALTTGEEKD